MVNQHNPNLKAHSQPCRPLTMGERAIAHSVFGSTLALDDIRLCCAWWVLKGYAISPNGHIYFNKHDFKADYSQENIYQQAWLVHELTHVWQLQQGIPVFIKALFNRRYRYKLIANKPFFAYGVEQQARMVEDYYKKRALHEPYRALLAFIPFTEQSHPNLQA